MHPNRTVNVMRLVDSHTPSHFDGESATLFEPDANGWFDFPHAVAQRLRRFRTNGSGWFAEGEVADAVRLGHLDRVDEPIREAPQRAQRSEPEPPRRGPGRPRKVESEEV